MSTPAVLKFGGSNFTSASDYLAVADYVCQRLAPPSGVVVVTSAMAGETDRLQARLEDVTAEAPGWIQDALLATGETASAHLLAAALTCRGVAVEVLAAPRLGIRTNSEFTRAVAHHIDPGPLRQALATARVVVVAGGQAVDTEGRTTMLGRNSSDLSAILVAATLGAHQCEIFSDVCGIYSADPYVVECARLLPELPYAAAECLSVLGAKVLHHTAVAEAARNRVSIVCRKLQAGRANTGTVVGTGTWPHAVVVNNAVTVAVFENARSRTKAAERLREANHFPFEIDCHRRFGLACAVDAVQAWRDLRSHGPLPSWYHTGPLVSVVFPDITKHEVADTLEAARMRARELHNWMQSGIATVAGPFECNGQP